MLTQQEISEVFLEFLNASSTFWDFKQFIEQQGYKMEEFGLPED